MTDRNSSPIPPPPSDLGSRDFAMAAAKGLLGMAPGGSIVTELLGLVLAPALARRKDRWLEDLAEVVRELQRRVAALTPEALAQNESFVTTALQASQVVLRTHREEKRRALRNAVLNSALPGAPSEDLQAVFLAHIDQMTPSHLRLLAFFEDPEAWFAEGTGRQRPSLTMVALRVLILQHVLPELLADPELCAQMGRDLHSRGLLSIDSFETTMTGRGLFAPRTTKLGKEFLRFVADPPS